MAVRGFGCRRLLDKIGLGEGVFGGSLVKNRHYTNYSREPASRERDPAVSTPNWIAFRVTKNEGIGASHDFTGKNPFAFALLDS
jgi:hypothetical protein